MLLSVGEAGKWYNPRPTVKNRTEDIWTLERIT
jgi:hypothetical protein